MRYAAGRRVWLTALFVVVVAAGVSAVGFAVRRGALDTATKAVPLVMTLFGTAVALWHWVRRRSVPDVSTPAQLDEALEALAETLESQWRAEASRRGLASPAPVRLAWEMTRLPVTDRPWAVQGAVEPDRTAPAGPDAPAVDTPAVDAPAVDAPAPRRTGRTKTPLLNAGTVRNLRDLFEALPNKRLAIIGAAGTGKTSAAVLFLLDVLARRERGGHVPLLVSIPGWDAQVEHLVSFVARQVAQDHPYLRDPRYGNSAPLGLVASGRVMPICDGLDEIPEAKRMAAVAALNGSGLPRLIVTSRAEEYQRATVGQVLAGAAVIELLPVDLDAATDFLSEGRSPRCLADWEQVFAAMRREPGGPVRAALTTPLALSLARRVYVDRSPVELLETDGFVTPANVEDHLLDGLVPVSYADLPEQPDATGQLRRYNATKALRWLRYIASQAHRRETFNLAWWRLPRLVPWPRRASASMLLYAMIAWALTSALWNDEEYAVTFGMSLAAVPLIACVIAFRRNMDLTPASFTWTFGLNHLIRSLTHGVKVAVGVAVAVTLALQGIVLVAPPQDMRPAPFRFIDLLQIGVAVGVAIGFAATLGAAVGRAGPTVAPSPGRSFRAHLAYLLVGRLLAAVLAAMLLYVVSMDPDMYRLSHVKEVVTYGVLIGLAFAVTDAGGQYLVTVGLLAVAGRLPWRLLVFLKDARRRGVLRQQGAMYQFRHARLQERLAAAYRPARGCT